MTMPKLTNVFEEKAEGLENINKRITKNVSENIHKVDSIISSARSPSALFNIQAISARIKLRDACERAVMSGSITYTQRMEEIIWRKVYYEPLSIAKKMRKGTSWSDIEAGYIWAHLNDGIAFYHHFLMTLMSSESNFTNYIADLLPTCYHDYESSSKSKENNHTSLEDSFFRSLTCLGDLARYMLDIPLQISSNTYLLSVRYYHQALHHNCEGGLTHSNLATVYSTNNHPLLAAVHYLRAVTCEKPFEAAENNLRRMLDKSRIWLENKKLEKEFGSSKEGNLGNESTRFLHSCLSLLSCFINNRRMEEVAVLCQDVLLQLGKLLDNYDNVEPPDVSETSSDPPAPNFKSVNGCIEPITPAKIPLEEKDKDGGKEGDQFLLTPESMVTLCALFITCVKRLKMQGSPHSNMSEVLLISILLTLVTHINTRLEQRFALIDPSFINKLLPTQEQLQKSEESANDGENNEGNLCNGDKNRKNKIRRNKLSKLRRKRNKELEIGNEEDSENEGDEYDGNSEVSCNGDEGSSSDEDQDFDASILCSSEDEESDDDVKIESEEEWEGMTGEEHVQLVAQEGMLASVNVTLQWLFSSEEMIKLCGRTAHNLWSSLAKLFNLLRVDYEKIQANDASSQKALVLSQLREMRKESFDFDNEDEELKSVIGSLPENLMLHLVIPMFPASFSSAGSKISEANLLRLYRLNLIMLKLCNRDDTPLKMKDDKFVICEEKAKAIAENEKNSEGRNTPSTPTPNSASSVGVVSKVEENGSTRHEDSLVKVEDLSQLTSQSTPKRLPPASISSKVASSMQSLTAQWLQHEVRSLEEKTSRRTKLGGLYLVPDASVLISHLSAIKQILATPSHMVIIPQVVIDSLDQEKRESVGARDAIRWLEVKLRHGSRFMRAQRPHEKAHLPLIKYPKRKDKEAWEWFHLAECCYYLGAQMNKTDAKTPTVTLLVAETSDKMAKRSFSLQTLAEAAGAVLQSVDEFVRKWQISTKGHS